MNSESIKKSMDYFRQQVGQAFEEIGNGEITDLADLSEKINDKLEDRKEIPYIDKVYLYRYSKADAWNLCNLSLQQLSLSPVGRLNDMYEGVPIGKADNLSAVDRKILKEIVYMTCFSEDCDNSLMWAHYADSSQGMCVEYDLSWLDGEHPVFNYLFPIFYTSKRCIRSSLSDIAAAQWGFQYNCEGKMYGDEAERELEGVETLYLTKGESWSYEKEWRILVPKYKMIHLEHPVFENGTVPFACATKVLLGPRMSSDMKRFIKNIVAEIAEQRKKANLDIPIDVKEMKMQDDGYTLKEE